jgi:multicomponent K+:H+ antiporter subunit D
MTPEHWIIAPIVLPLLAGALALLAEKRSPRMAAAISLSAALLLAVIALRLVALASEGEVVAYLVGNWRAPFGIALALDRLSALMLMLTAVVGVAAAMYARGHGRHGRHDERSPHFHALFQFQLMGLNGAFLTADLFNLFVFFEVLLIASYGLLLHGAGAERLRASVHYVVFNLTGSALFLIAVSTLYGLTGTLNMADLAQRIATVPDESAALLQAAGLLLIVVFGVKAAIFPLYFWLTDTYGAATAPVAALFVIMTKVGVYCIARATTLMFGQDAGPAALVADPWLQWLALATLALAAFGALAAWHLRRLVAYLVLASAGTLLLAVGLGSVGTIAAGLFYLVHSTVVAAALFLLVDSIVASRGEAGDEMVPAPLAGAGGYGALFFLLAVAVAGLPPFGGFLGKSMLLVASRPEPWAVAVWTVVLLSSLGIVVALARAGSTVFWKAGAPNTMQTAAARASSPERGALALLVAAACAIVVLAAPLAQYTEATARQLLERSAYIQAVLGAEPVAPAWDPRVDMKKLK